MKRLFVCLLAATTVSLASNVNAQAIRSDSPLWTHDNASSSIFPQAFTDRDSFGCVHAINVGVWRYVETDEPDWPEYWRLGNYGVFHCALIFGRSDDEATAGEAFEGYAWLARLTEPSPGSDTIELWVLQIGVSGGSRYILLRRTGGALSSPFDVLNASCPQEAERRRANIDIWVQDDCIVSSKDDLIRMALSATTTSPTGRLEFIAPPASAELPSHSD